MSYLARVRRLRPPTLAQRSAFARAMAQRHSWYKHLPVWPFAPFRFYISADAPETSEPRGRLLDKRYAHVSDAATHESIFGFWGCHAPYQGGAGLDPEWREAVLRAEGSEIPREILDAGVVWVNAFVDPRAARNRWAWERFYGNIDMYGLVDYLKRLGHADARIENAREIAREVLTEAHVIAGRERMLEEMRAAMDRVQNLIYGN